MRLLTFHIKPDYAEVSRYMVEKNCKSKEIQETYFDLLVSYMRVLLRKDIFIEDVEPFFSIVKSFMRSPTSINI